MSKFVFIGGGNMASCLIGGMLANGVSEQDILVGEPSAETRHKLEAMHGVETTADNLSAASAAETIILAVKPQVLGAVAESLAPALDHGPTVISIAAGMPISALQNWLGEGLAIVRAMPNTPATVQTGATGLFANRSLAPNEKACVEKIFDAVGYTCWVQQETLIDAVTAVSGSGPAYFFLVYEAMLKVGQELGLDHQAATDLTLHTALGAARLALDSQLAPSELRQQVTSPGGTTQAAVESFQSSGLEKVFRDAMCAAMERANQMSEDFSK